MSDTEDLMRATSELRARYMRIHTQLEKTGAELVALEKKLAAIEVDQARLFSTEEIHLVYEILDRHQGYLPDDSAEAADHFAILSSVLEKLKRQLELTTE